MSERFDVAIVGGGVVGTSCAYYLAERGARVVLIEKGAIGSGCSHGNAGWIFPSHGAPLASRGVLLQAARWLFDPTSPFYVRLRPDPALLRFLWRFARANRGDLAREAFRLGRELSLASLDLYSKLAASSPVDFGFEQAGLLLVCRTAEALDELHEELQLLRELGGEGEALGGDALRERVPALAPDVVGGLRYTADAHVNPSAFVPALAQAAQGLGVELREGWELLDLTEREGGGIRLRTTRGELDCDELVFAAGAWSPRLLAPLGVRLPVEAGKGYSLTFRRPQLSPPAPLLLVEAKVGVTPMGDCLRFAGTLELAGLDLGVSLPRVRAIADAARSWLPGLPALEHVETWRGLRPLSPDGLPIIGRVAGRPGLVLATGHGMGGVSQGPITGQLVAQLLSGEPTTLDLAPFSPERFRSKAAELPRSEA